MRRKMQQKHGFSRLSLSGYFYAQGVFAGCDARALYGAVFRVISAVLKSNLGIFLDYTQKIEPSTLELQAIFSFLVSADSSQCRFTQSVRKQGIDIMFIL